MATKIINVPDILTSEIGISNVKNSMYIFLESNIGVEIPENLKAQIDQRINRFVDVRIASGDNAVVHDYEIADIVLIELADWINTISESIDGRLRVTREERDNPLETELGETQIVYEIILTPPEEDLPEIPRDEPQLPQPPPIEPTTPLDFRPPFRGDEPRDDSPVQPQRGNEPEKITPPEIDGNPPSNRPGNRPGTITNITNNITNNTINELGEIINEVNVDVDVTVENNNDDIIEAITDLGNGLDEGFNELRTDLRDTIENLFDPLEVIANGIQELIDGITPGLEFAVTASIQGWKDLIDALLAINKSIFDLPGGLGALAPQLIVQLVEAYDNIWRQHNETIFEKVDNILSPSSDDIISAICEILNYFEKIKAQCSIFNK